MHYFRVAVDARDLNYGDYLDEGDLRESALDDYHSHNTQRLDLDSVVEMLDKLPAFQSLVVPSFR